MVYYEENSTTKTLVPEESQRSIIYLFSEFYTNQMNLLDSYTRYLLDNDFNNHLLVQIKQRLNS